MGQKAQVTAPAGGRGLPRGQHLDDPRLVTIDDQLTTGDRHRVDRDHPIFRVPAADDLFAAAVTAAENRPSRMHNLIRCAVRVACAHHWRRHLVSPGPFTKLAGCADATAPDRHRGAPQNLPHQATDPPGKGNRAQRDRRLSRGSLR
ncbi:hypothetical protein BKA01_000238 [Pseudonocardia eucalypti]|nr:hypothetical protein [Pseudonocardia eucalypti]